MEENVENVVEETTQPTEQTVDESKFKSAGDDNVIKVDLSKPPKPEEENETKEDNADDSGVAAESKDAEPTEKQEEVQPEAETQETPVLEEVTEETTKPVENIESVVEEQTGQAIPEGLQKVIDFMEETGGSLEDYVKLNQDYGNYDDMAILKEFYKQTKPHLTEDEINFLIEDNFIYNEEIEEERDVRKKKIALKEQVASAKAHLDGQKSKYYEEVKAGSKLTKEQQKAIDFFNRYNKESEENKKIVDNNTKVFELKTNKLFNNKFKGFSYDVGDKKYRFNVKNTDDVKQKQSNINNFMTKFVDKNSTLVDAEGYHKGLFTAMNPDAIAKHFYEQGKADALKESIAKSKNVDMNPRQAFGGVEAGGIKVRVLGDNSNDFKFKIKNNK